MALLAPPKKKAPAKKIAKKAAKKAVTKLKIIAADKAARKALKKPARLSKLEINKDLDSVIMGHCEQLAQAVGMSREHAHRIADNAIEASWSTRLSIAALIEMISQEFTAESNQNYFDTGSADRIIERLEKRYELE